MKLNKIIIAAALLSATTIFAYAETPDDHSAHHPSAASEPAPKPQPQAPTGVMGQGMMGQGGVMGGGSMMNMMGNGMPMMGMMQMMMGSGGTGGMATIDRVEGRIAFLKTELKITDAQGDAWNAFADVLRSNARKLGELRASMMPQASLVDRLTWQEKWLTTRSEDTRAIRVAYIDLAAKLTDDQEKSAEQLLAPHMGMLTMMSGLGSGQMMGGMGTVNPGQMPMMPGNPMTTGRMPPSK
jgi:hypothetical protein